jgi:6-phosphogluconate dehydrogenase
LTFSVSTAKDHFLSIPSARGLDVKVSVTRNVLEKATKMFQNVPKCSKMFQNVPKCSKMFQNVPKSSKIFQNGSILSSAFLENVSQNFSDGLTKKYLFKIKI